MQNVQERSQFEHFAYAQYQSGEKLPGARAAIVPKCEIWPHLWQACCDHATMMKAD